MFNLRLCNAATIRYSQLKFGHMHLCGMNYKCFSPQCFKCYSFGCTAAIRCGNACQGPHSDSLYSGSEHIQFNSPRLVKREVGFPDPRRALIGSNQLWRVNDSPYYREYHWVILDPKSKEDKVKATNLKNSPKLNPMSIVGDTEQTQFCPQMDRRTDGRTDRRTRWNQYTPLSTSLKRGV